MVLDVLKKNPSGLRRLVEVQALPLSPSLAVSLSLPTLSPPLGAPLMSRHSPTVGSQGEVISYERGIPVSLGR